MRKAFFFLTLIILSANAMAQNNADSAFKKVADGTEYMIYPSANGTKINAGNFFEMNVLVKYKDSILYSTLEEGMPQFALFDTSNFPAAYKVIFSSINTSDSIVVRTTTDSIIAKGQAAPFMEKGQYIYQCYAITNVFTTQAQTDSAQKIHIPIASARAFKKQMAQIQKNLDDNKEQIANDSKIIEDYLVKNKIKAIKAPWGTYVAVKKEGTGDKLTMQDIAAVNYTGKSFGSNKVFDSNTDPKFKHVQPYDVNIGRGGQPDGVIIGWTDALLQMKRGTVATVYIPSSLGYGTGGNPQGGIAPNAILVFDMNVVKVNNEPAPKTMIAPKPKVKPAVKAAPSKTILKPKPTIKKAGK